MPRRPLDVLEDSLGEPVSVRLKDDTSYEGILAGFDQHLNVVLEGATVGSSGDGNGHTEPGDAESKAPTNDVESGEDTIVIRGDNVVSITP
jgi:small nuclear ribonucleoprotein